MEKNNLIKQGIKILGSLNPGIIQPKWLSDKGVIESESNTEWLFPVGEVIAPLRFKLSDLEWIVDYKSLEISSSQLSSSEKLKDFISKIFNLLPETPLTATGHNFTYNFISESLNLNFLGNEQWCVGNNFSEKPILKTKHQVEIEIDSNRSLNISVGKEANNISVGFNFHYNVKTIEELILSLKEFNLNFKIASQYIQRINSREVL